MHQDKQILIGKIVKAHGIRGEVIIHSFTSPPLNMVNLPAIDEDFKPMSIQLVRSQARANQLICRIDGSISRNDAEKLQKKLIYCLRSALPPIADQEQFYVTDLIGLQVLNRHSEVVGHVVDVANYGAGDIIAIKFIAGQEELFPFTREFFPTISLDHIIFTNN